MERELGASDWKGKTYEQKRLREKFGRYSNGWQTHDEGGRCFPPRSWSPDSQKDFVDGYEAARRTHPERMLEALEQEDWDVVTERTAFGDATWTSRAERVTTITKLRRLMPPNQWIVRDSEGETHLVDETDIELDGRSTERTGDV